jgi:hypothetical protein
MESKAKGKTRYAGQIWTAGRFSPNGPWRENPDDRTHPGTAKSVFVQDSTKPTLSFIATQIKAGASTSPPPLVAGRRAATARELVISREWASHIAKAPETQQIIASLAQEHLERIYDLFEEALRVIQDAFRADVGRFVKVRSSTIVAEARSLRTS